MSGPPVQVARKEYDPQDESMFRESVRKVLKNSYDKRGDLVVPLGKNLTFTSAQGQKITFGYTAGGEFTVKQDTGTPFSLASITYVSSVESSLDGAISTVSSEVVAARQGEASLTAKVTQLSTATSTVDGKLSASYALTVDGNGRIASMKLLSNGVTSSVKFVASTFTIYDGTSDLPMFEVAGGAAYVAGNKVRTDSIVDTAVSATSAMFSASGATTSLTVTTTGGDLVISASFQSELGADGGPSDYATHDAEIARGATVIYESYGPINQAGAGVSALGYSIASWAATTMDSPAAGTYTFSVSAPYNNSNGNLQQMRNVAIVVTELKK